MKEKKCTKHKDVKLRLKPQKARMYYVHGNYLGKAP